MQIIINLWYNLEDLKNYIYYIKGVLHGKEKAEQQNK